MLNIKNQIEEIIVENGTIKIKLKKYNKYFVVYDEFLRYYIKHNKQKIFLDEKSRNQVISFCNSY